MAQCVAGELYYEIDGQLLEIKRQLRQLSGYPYDPSQLRSALQVVIEGRFGEKRITVNYNLSLADMLIAGRYNWVHECVTEERFPISRVGTTSVAVELVYIDCATSPEDVIAQMRSRGQRPATFMELLAYAVQFREDKQKLKIVALGTVAFFGQDQVFACFSVTDSRREIDLCAGEGNWSRSLCFLAVSAERFSLYPRGLAFSPRIR